MNDKVTTQEGQNLMDLAIQHLGDQSGVFDLAMKNDVSMTDPVAPGTKLDLPDVIDNQVTGYFAEKQLFPATNNAESEILTVGGIGYMGIEIDFIVS